MKPAVAALVLLVVTVAACGGGGSTATTGAIATGVPSTTAAQSPTTAPPITGVDTPSPTTATPATTDAPVSTTALTRPPASDYSAVPVGSDGVQYRGTGAEIEVVGPSRVAVDPGGTVYFYDPVGNAVWTLPVTGGVEAFALGPLDILNVEVMAATDTDLVLVEIFFAPVRRRIQRISPSGELLATFELPDGFGLEDGLSGIHAAADGSVWLEFAGGEWFAPLGDGSRPPVRSDVLELDGVSIVRVGNDLVVDGRTITADLAGFGGLRFLSLTVDGSVVILREDVVQTSPEWRVLSTVEWYRDGALSGSARVPLEAQAIDQPPGITVHDDGTVLVLLAGADSVTVHELDPTPGRITELDPVP